MKKIFAFLLLFIFCSFSTAFASENLFSPKKGVAGGASLENLNKLNSSWFYNWAYFPVYKTANNWDPAVWQKFVPLFYSIMGRDDKLTELRTQIDAICSAPNVGCNGRYYLIGNEPLIQDSSYGDTGTNSINDRNIAYEMVQRYGKIIKTIKSRDANAKFIILGMDNIEDQRDRKLTFVSTFINKWGEYWRDGPTTKDETLKDLSLLIKGWHVHTYGTYNNSNYCPADDSAISGFLSAVNSAMENPANFGRRVANQELWVTEMGTLDGLPDFNLPGDENRRQEFAHRMECLVNVYENSPLVTRYAWFYYGCSSTFHSYCSSPTGKYNLFLPNTTDPSGFTQTYLGTKYASLATAALQFKIKFPYVGADNTLAKTVKLEFYQGTRLISSFENVSVSNLNDNTGAYQGSVSDIPPGAYDIYLKGWGHLRKKIGSGVVLVSGNNQADYSAVNLPAGDINNDNKIQINDITGVLSSWVSSQTPITYQNRNYDLNLDGKISLEDITAVLSNWTTSSVVGE